MYRIQYLVQFFFVFTRESLAITSLYTNFEYAEMIRLYCQNGCIAVHVAQAYEEQYPNAPHKAAPKTIQRTWAHLFGITFPVSECGARRTVLTIRKEEKVLDLFNQDGTQSIREVSRETDISPRSVGRVLRGNECAHLISHTCSIYSILIVCLDQVFS